MAPSTRGEQKSGHTGGVPVETAVYRRRDGEEAHGSHGGVVGLEFKEKLEPQKVQCSPPFISGVQRSAVEFRGNPQSSSQLVQLPQSGSERSKHPHCDAMSSPRTRRCAPLAMRWTCSLEAQHFTDKDTMGTLVQYCSGVTACLPSRERGIRSSWGRPGFVKLAE